MTTVTETFVSDIIGNEMADTSVDDKPHPQASTASLVGDYHDEATCSESGVEYNDTPIHVVASLMDAKLADVHAVLENHTESLQRVLQLLELLESRLGESHPNQDQQSVAVESPVMQNKTNPLNA